jgi:hypothetical protein
LPNAYGDDDASDQNEIIIRKEEFQEKQVHHDDLLHSNIEIMKADQTSTGKKRSFKREVHPR